MAVSAEKIIEQGAVPNGTPPVDLGVVKRLLSGLNREQRQAVTHRDGPQIVLAGPGTGKTEVVTRRIAWLIATRRALPREVLGLTFTDNAAQEMQARVDALVPYGQADTQIHTYHAYGDRLIRAHAFELGLSGDLRLLTRAELVVLLRDNMFDLGLERYLPLGDPTRFLGALVDLFNRAKDEGVTPQQVADHAAELIDSGAASGAHDSGTAAAELARAYEKYEQLLRARGLIDHGDQLALTLRLLERPATRDEILDRFKYVLVDEFQDMNPAQLRLVVALSERRPNVTVVGDPDQSIYAFRGAAARNLRAFADRYPDSSRVVLRRNYRSSAHIVRAAQRLIGHATRWHVAETDEGPTAARGRRTAAVRVLAHESPAEEADAVAQQINDRVAAGEHPTDFAVLARSNSEIETIARSLVVRGVPVRTRTPTDFFAQRAVRPLLAFLRVATDPDQALELYVVASAWPYELGGPELTEVLARARRTHSSPWRLLAEIADSNDRGGKGRFGAGVRRLVGDIRAAIEDSHRRSSGELLYDHLRRTGCLSRLAREADPAEAQAVARFFDVVRSRASLLRDGRVAAVVPHLDAYIDSSDEWSDNGPLDDDAVSILTVHRAKGLEFRVVYVTGLVDGRFPARERPAALDLPWAEIRKEQVPDEDRLDDERRLFYVAMTRARDELYLSHHRRAAGGRIRRRPSPFLAEALDLPVEIAVGPEAAPQDPLQRMEAMAETRVNTEPAVAWRPPDSLSFSQLEEYIDCPERFRLRHVVQVPTPAHHALSYGRALHEAVAYFHMGAAKGSPPSEADLLAAYARAWSADGYVSRKHEEARFEAGKEALIRFRNSQLEETPNVVAVERPFEFVHDGVRIRGRLDRVDATPAGPVIVDYKSSDVADQEKADGKARDSLQLQVYALAHAAHNGKPPHEVALHFLGSGIVGRATPDAARLERARQKVSTALGGIARGEFEPRPNPVGCGYCPYRQLCAASAA
jgi:DNA helicase-2/ATP-dependent DNA helicase PcrA